LDQLIRLAGLADDRGGTDVTEESVDLVESMDVEELIRRGNQGRSPGTSELGR
jgi:hypothetical protein